MSDRRDPPQDPSRARALVVPHKIERVYNYHRATLHALAELIAAAGLDHPQQIRSIHFSQRTSTTEVQSFARSIRRCARGELIDGTSDPRFASPGHGAGGNVCRGGVGLRPVRINQPAAPHILRRA